jgi:hypothetical protein
VFKFSADFGEFISFGPAGDRSRPEGLDHGKRDE